MNGGFFQIETATKMKKNPAPQDVLSG